MEGRPDVQAQKLDVTVGKFTANFTGSPKPVFWTTKDKSIVTTFNFTDDQARTIYEFDALTLKTIEAPFNGDTGIVHGLALLSDCLLLRMLSFTFYAKSFPPARTQFVLFATTSFFPATSPLPRSHMNPYENVSEDLHNHIFDLHSSSLDPYRHRPPPNPLRSNPIYTDYRPGGPFKQIMQHQLSSTFLSHRVNWYARLLFLVVFHTPCIHLQQNAAAGAPGQDDGLIRDEDYASPPSPNPDLQQPPTAKMINAGEYGSGRLCFSL
ncbi:hypothetical protein EDB19DRAFT_1932243 [Suillus lakei]|nr:hypothetical protein EDB19DRAFT_1932243 [Suillus lakei]